MTIVQSATLLGAICFLGCSPSGSTQDASSGTGASGGRAGQGGGQGAGGKAFTTRCKGFETIDAQTYASWGIDYLKYDHCAATGLGGFATMRDALKAAGRPIFYSINPGDGTGCPPNTCSINLLTIANMWRIGFDINASWSSMIGLVDQDANLFSYAGPGHWNDPDMMEVGNGLNDTEGRTHLNGSYTASSVASRRCRDAAGDGHALRSLSRRYRDQVLTSRPGRFERQDVLQKAGAFLLHPSAVKLTGRAS